MPDVKGLLSNLMFAFFPKRCGFCGTVIAPVNEICGDCKNSDSRIKPPVCELCGRGKDECSCMKKQCFYVSLAAPFYYENEIRKCIWNFKFRSKTINAKILAQEMAKTANIAYADKKFDIITFVPLTAKSQKDRGFNQSLLLADEVGRILKLKTSHELLIKIYDTPAQHTMNSSMRRGNLAGVFDVVNSDSIRDKTVLLCDDVATTGSTLNECAKMLILSGAREVYCLVAAVTRKKVIS